MALDGHSAVLWSGNIYIWGGKEDATGTTARHTNALYSNAMYILNPSECISKPTVVLQKIHLGTREIDSSTGRPATVVTPRGRAYHTSTLYGKQMVVVGGLTEDVTNPEAEASNLPVFDLERRVWTVKASFGDVPCPRCHHVAVCYGDTLFVHGGYPILPERAREISADEMASMQHAMYDVCELSMATMRWRRIQNPQSPALWGHSAVLYNKNVILFGGVDVIENTESGAVAVWHTEKKQWRWSDFENLELRCAMHTAALDGARMFVFSGVSYKTHTKLRSLYEFNIEFGSWRELTPKGAQPLGRIGHAVVSYNQCMFVIGGSVESPNNPSMTAGKTERAVHVYNVALNEWRSCALMMQSADESGFQGPKFVAREKSWGSGSLDAGATQAAAGEWAQTAQQVRETIARAKAIQSLADNAMGSVAAGDADTANYGAAVDLAATGAYPPARAGGAGSPSALNEAQRQYFDASDARRAAAAAGDASATQRMGASGGFRSNSTAQTEPSAAEQQLDKLRDLRQGLNNEESRRVIEHLNRENELLRQQLDAVRSGSVRAADASGRNPYEVLIYNTAVAAASPSSPTTGTLPANAIPPLVGRGDDTRLGSNTLGDFVPRLNLNAAEPPRAVSGSMGYMSRGAVSALVQSSLNRDVTATSTMDIPPPNLRMGSLDPMAFLTAPSAMAQNSAAAAAWHPANYAPPQSYDQLLSRAHVGDNTYYATANLPLTLQPLLTLISGAAQLPIPTGPSGQSFAGGGGGSAFLGGGRSPTMGGGLTTAVSGAALNASFRSNQQFSNESFSAAPASAGNYGPAPPQRAKSPSLSKVVSGQASMLSLPLSYGLRRV